MLLGNTVALVIYGISMAHIINKAINNGFSDNSFSDTFVLLIQTISATLIVLLFAEFLPKVLFRINPNKTLNAFAVPVSIFYYIFYPLIYTYIGLSEFILRRFIIIKLRTENRVFGVNDLDHYFKEFTTDFSDQSEVQQEIQMFQNAIDFRSVKLRECMIPRTEIIALDENEEISTLRSTFIASGHSKIPIYRNSIDNIIGYTHSADIFKNPATIKSIMRPIIVAPETMLANVVLSMFIQQNKSIAVVVDEFGGTSGIITMEDVIEEIFGEINDEFDVEDLTEKKISDYEFIFSGRLEIDYLNENYQLNILESDDYETLAGFIIHQYESIPKQNDHIKIDIFEFIILEASETRIEKVKLIISDKNMA
jgi:CBS domain containing-hemolysin-like protein